MQLHTHQCPLLKTRPTCHSPFLVGSPQGCAAPSNRTRRVRVSCRSESGSTETQETTNSEPSPTSATPVRNLDKEFAKFTRGTANKFAPRASGPAKNPAFKGSTLYTIFEVQAWLSLVVGGLLSYNVIWPTDKPSIARLLGMWSLWIFTVPSLRARDCSNAEKDALNLLFIAIPVINVTLPFVWKSFPFVYTADVAALAAVYYWKLGPQKSA